MSQFNYIARTKDGIRKEGTLDAENINIASEQLRKDGLIVVKIDERDMSFDFLTPFLMTIPLQLLAYHVASLKNYDIDKPRNLAKSVTVE